MDVAKLLNPVVLNVVIVVLLLALLVALGIALKTGRKLKVWGFSLGGANVPNIPEAAKGTDGPARGYRKILYIKVTYLSDKAAGGAPFYTRVVSRLQDPNIAVYDEGVYYTLELFSTKKEIGARTDRSTGVVDPRMLIPWKDRIVPRETTARSSRESVEMNANEDSDTLLTVSHFDNGLQGKENQDFAADVPEDAEYVRLVVDFSSVPGAGLFVLPKEAYIVSANGASSLAAITACGDSVYMLLRENARKGEMLRMCFSFDWSRLPRPTQ